MRELTGRIGYDGVEERATSPRISRDIKGAQVQDALPNSILCRGAHDPRLCLWWKQLHECAIRMRERAQIANLSRASADHQCPSRIREHRNKRSSGVSRYFDER
jgi:hypothetical protein